MKDLATGDMTFDSTSWKYAPHMDFGIEGKVAMVAAGSKGIGLATATALAAEGCVVSICGRNEDSLKAARESIGANARSYVADVSKAEDIERWVAQDEE